MPGVYTLKNPKNIPQDAVYVGRGRGSVFGNPFTHINDRKTAARYVVDSRKQAVESYASWIVDQDSLMREVHNLSNKDLVCWCHEWNGVGPNPMYCHADILLDIARRIIL